MGGIFKLDYSGVQRNSLLNIWKATNNIYPDLSKATYKTFIIEWGKKYGFINNKTIEKTSITNNNSDKKEYTEVNKTKNQLSASDDKTSPELEEKNLLIPIQMIFQQLVR